MSMKPVTFEASEETIAMLDEIAGNVGESREYVLREAVASYLAGYEQLQAEVDEAEQQIDAGKFFTQDEMEARFEAKLHRTEAA